MVELDKGYDRTGLAMDKGPSGNGAHRKSRGGSTQGKGKAKAKTNFNMIVGPYGLFVAFLKESQLNFAYDQLDRTLGGCCQIEHSACLQWPAV